MKRNPSKNLIYLPPSGVKKPPSVAIRIVHQLNKHLFEHNANAALMMLCCFLAHHNLAVNLDLLDQIPVRPQPDRED